MSVGGGSGSGSGQAALIGTRSASNAVSINAGVGSIPATITAPNGGVVIGSRNTIVGAVGGTDVAFDPDSHQHQ